MKYIIISIVAFFAASMGLRLVQASVEDLNTCDDVATMAAVFYDMAHEEGMTEAYYFEVLDYNIDNGMEMGASEARLRQFRSIGATIWAERGADREQLLQTAFETCEAKKEKVIS